MEKDLWIFLRTLKRRKPKKHITARVNGAPPKSNRASSGGIRVKKLSATLNLASCLALFLGLAVVTQSQAQDYYFYEGPKGELAISNKEPPPGTKIIKRLPSMTRETPQAPEPAKPQPNIQPESQPKPTKNK